MNFLNVPDIQNQRAAYIEKCAAFLTANSIVSSKSACLFIGYVFILGKNTFTIKSTMKLLEVVESSAFSEEK